MASFTNKAYHKLVKSHNHATTQLQQKRRKQFKNLDKLYQKKPEEEPADGGNAARQAITQEYLQLESDMTEKHEQELATFEAGKKAAEESAANADADAAASGVAKMSVSGSGDGGDGGGSGGGGGGGGKKKLTRYEKRKQKQLAEEKRIDEERAAIESTQTNQKEYEIEQILNSLTPLGFTIKDIKADGHCLFTSVAHQLALRNGEELTDNKACYEMRKIATSHMRSHSDNFAPFIEGDIEE